MVVPSPGRYFASKGIAPSQLAQGLERLRSIEREVLLARAAAESLRSIGKRLDLTPEGVRYLEQQAINKLKGEGISSSLEKPHRTLEQQLGEPLETLLERLSGQEREVLLWHANQFPLTELAVALQLSLAEVIRLRDQAMVKLKGTADTVRADQWEDLKAVVENTLKERSLTYKELIALLPISRGRISRLMAELVAEGRADVNEELPMRFIRPQTALPGKKGQKL